MGALTVVLAMITVVFVFKPLSIVYPGAGLDDSWMAVLGEAGARPVRWGVDLAFSYGPASTILTRYFTDHYLLVALPVVAATALAAAATFVMLIRTPSLARHPTGLVLAAAALHAMALVPQVTQDADGFVFAFVVNLYVLDVLQPQRTWASRGALIVGAASLGVLALAKTSFGFVALLLFGLADSRSIVLRRVPWLTPTFVAASLVADLAYGQRLGDLPALLAMQWSFAAGYAEAMYIDGNRLELLLYLASSAALVMIAAGRRGRNPERVWVAVGLAGALLLGLKAGFVRADSHTQIAWSLLGLVGLSVAAALVLPRSAPSAGRLAAVSLAVLWVWAPLMLILDTHRPKRWSELATVYSDMVDGTLAEIGAWSQVVQDPGGFASQARDDKAAAWDAVREQTPLPKLDGTVDILPSRQSSILANRLAFHPRPSFQEYATYDRRLIDANLAFYTGSSRPDWVLFGTNPIDNRYPAFTEGALWPILLSRYEAIGRAGSWAVLRARPAPITDADSAPQQREVSLGETIFPPPGATFATMSVRKTLVGKVAALLYRNPALRLNVTTQDGISHSFRLVPAIASGGFVLSPFIADADQFAEFSRGGTLTGQFVASFSVTTDLAAGVFYERAMTVTFRSLTPARSESDDVPTLLRQLGIDGFDRAAR